MTFDAKTRVQERRRVDVLISRQRDSELNPPERAELEALLLKWDKEHGGNRAVRNAAREEWLDALGSFHRARNIHFPPAALQVCQDRVDFAKYKLDALGISAWR
jgi:hypothetical protein